MRMQTDVKYFITALFLFIMLHVLLALGAINYLVAGIYPFDYDRVVILPRDIIQFVLYIIVVGLAALLLAAFMRLSYLNDLFGYLRKIIKSADKALSILVLSILFIILYVLNIDDSHFSIMDSYELMAGALEIIHDQKYSFLHKAAPGGSLALIPFMLLQPTELASQIAIIIYSALAYVAIIYTWYKVNVYEKKESKYFYLFGLLVIANPMFVAISRTISYEPILLLVLSLLLLKVYNITTGKHRLSDFLLVWILLVYVITLRVNYIVVIVGPTLLVLFLYFTWSYIISAKNLKGFVIAFTYLALMGISSLVSAIALLPEWARQGSNVAVLFSWRYFIENLPGTLYILASAINSPPSRTAFRFLLFELLKISAMNIILGVIIFRILVTGIIDLLRKKDLRFFGMYVILLMLSNVLFFTSYEGWQARYLCISILLELFVITKAMYAMVFAPSGKYNNIEQTHRSKYGLSRYTRMFIISFTLMVMLAASNSAITAISWQSESVRVDNSDQLMAREFEEVFTYINQFHGKKIVFTSYEAAATFYKYKLRADFSIFFVYEFFSKKGIYNDTIRYLLDEMSSYLAENYLVFYLAGWPEIDGHSFSPSQENYSSFYKYLLSSSEYDIIRVGPETKRQSRFIIAPIYILLAIKRIY
ncbi:MAG: hypothetical protein QXY55_03565 [Candidatus Korarchaeota archaeon]